MRKATSEVGRAAEEAVAKHLNRAGMRILARNFRCKAGEIDIVARAGSVIVFVEVRSLGERATHRPGETIDQHKQRRIVRAAQWYLKAQKLMDAPCRFDVAEVYLDEQQRPQRINHIEHAFTA